MTRPSSRVLGLATCCLLTACAAEETLTPESFYGTLEPFASEAVYFVVTDRFVDGDESNNQQSQGEGQTATFDRPIQLDGEPKANIGYLGGDFRGIVDNADYIAEMGFSALWITPIVDNPDEAFLGGTLPGQGIFTDRGKTGYHGYWGVNFFRVDEHLESDNLTFADLTRQLRNGHDIRVVLDIVCNHGSPAYTNPVEQPKFGEIYNAEGELIADHQNLRPGELDLNNPLHTFFSDEPDLAELADVDPHNPAVLDYFVAAYSKWIEQGASAFRVDTIRHMPHSFWRAFAERIRSEHPNFFMFGESFDYDARKIAEHTYIENGNVSVLDFPGQEAIGEVFAGNAPYSRLLDYLHLDSGVYQNPYELMTFYDNHDMPRMAADDHGFIDANNWLFTSRGIPVVYYGSEVGFMAGAREHGGNRNYFGQDNIDAAREHPIRKSLTSIAKLREALPALQRGLQVNLEFTENTASFYRVYQHDGIRQAALVLLNKGDAENEFSPEILGSIEWRDAMTNQSVENVQSLSVAPHGVRVLITDGLPDVIEPSRLRALQKMSERPAAGSGGGG
ncbi:MAG: alpha-amylase family glycosyl hydrolase [Pseudomonadota bacterium]